MEVSYNPSNKRYVLITGAAGGMGAACVRELARRGFEVVASDFSAGGIPDCALPLTMDVTSEASVADALERISAITGSLYAIVHLAGVYTMDSFVEIEESQLNNMLQVNLMGVYRVNKAFLPLVRSGGGRIVIVTSELAPLDPLPFNGIYSMTKTALDSYAHSLALELDLIGVRVVTLRPGAFGDGMPKASLRAMERMQASSKLFSGNAERFRKVMMGEIGSSRDPEEFARWLVKILQKKKPAFEYAVNNSVKLKLFSALPTSLQAFALRLLLKGKN